MTDRDALLALAAKARVSALMAIQNSEGCAANHYGHDAATFGMPAWLSDCRADVETFFSYTLPALLDRLEAAERGWQPIETAPRTGETVLLFNADEQLVDCGFFCTWVGDDRPGHWEVTGNNHWYQGDVTHWRPLPDAPAIREVKP